MFMSIRTLFAPEHENEKRVSLENLLWLAFLYGTIMIGFALIYLLFELQNYSVILEHGKRVSGDFFKQLVTASYFSTITMFSVGYGDIVPIGLGRLFAVVQAFIGYTLPAAFVVRTVIDFENIDREG
ncbi:two pore domain potassium channel family protein [Peribacillus saganii]|uniref:Two pore domain potassium channel family protein n=2 Tax=Peribacillus saganii TaxID=2303992 RepID=A0A372LMP7_9BACI|nr:two pore domain potassium channel family protein [Peribacillus saganii]